MKKQEGKYYVDQGIKDKLAFKGPNPQLFNVTASESDKGLVIILYILIIINTDIVMYNVTWMT